MPAATGVAVVCYLHSQLKFLHLRQCVLCLQVKDFRSLPVDSHPNRLGPQDREKEAAVQPGWQSETTSEQNFITAINATAGNLSERESSEGIPLDWNDQCETGSDFMSPLEI